MKQPRQSSPTLNSMNRRRFLATAGTGSALTAVPLTAAERPTGTRLTTSPVDCQSHLSLPEVLDLVHWRKAEAADFGEQDNSAIIEVLRKQPPASTP